MPSLSSTTSTLDFLAIVVRHRVAIYSNDQRLPHPFHPCGRPVAAHQLPTPVRENERCASVPVAQGPCHLPATGLLPRLPPAVRCLQPQTYDGLSAPACDRAQELPCEREQHRQLPARVLRPDHPVQVPRPLPQAQRGVQSVRADEQALLRLLQRLEQDDALQRGESVLRLPRQARRHDGVEPVLLDPLQVQPDDEAQVLPVPQRQPDAVV